MRAAPSIRNLCRSRVGQPWTHSRLLDLYQPWSWTHSSPAQDTLIQTCTGRNSRWWLRSWLVLMTPNALRWWRLANDIDYPLPLSSASLGYGEYLERKPHQKHRDGLKHCVHLTGLCRSCQRTCERRYDGNHASEPRWASDGQYGSHPGLYDVARNADGALVFFQLALLANCVGMSIPL
jgi:hypothetical protein